MAEWLVVSGRHSLLNITSPRQVTTLDPLPYFILIERALRDEGTSYHYLPASSGYAEAELAPLSVVEGALAKISDPVQPGATWTADAPYRETREAIAKARASCNPNTLSFEAAYQSVSEGTRMVRRRELLGMTTPAGVGLFGLWSRYQAVTAAQFPVFPVAHTDAEWHSLLIPYRYGAETNSFHMAVLSVVSFRLTFPRVIP